MFGKKSARAWILCRHWSGLEVYLSNHRNVFQSLQNWSKLHSSRIVIVIIILVVIIIRPLAAVSWFTCHMPPLRNTPAKTEAFEAFPQGASNLSVSSHKARIAVPYRWGHASPFAPLSNSKWNPTPNPCKTLANRFSVASSWLQKVQGRTRRAVAPSGRKLILNVSWCTKYRWDVCVCVQTRKPKRHRVSLNASN